MLPPPPIDDDFTIMHIKQLLLHVRTPIPMEYMRHHRFIVGISIILMLQIKRLGPGEAVGLYAKASVSQITCVSFFPTFLSVELLKTAEYHLIN